MHEVIIKLILVGLIPVAFAIGFRFLDKSTRFKSLSYWPKQIILGIIFGGLSILGTELGVATSEGAVINVRDAAPVIAGFVFGGPAGIIAGFIGGIERFVSVLWNSGRALTQWACTISTIMAGLFAATIRKLIFDGHHGRWYYGFIAGVFVEAFHMMMVFTFSLNDVNQAYNLVKLCCVPMMVANGLCIMVSLIGVAIVSGEELLDHSRPLKTESIVQIGLFFAIAISFTLVSYFTYRVLSGVEKQMNSSDNAGLFVDVAIYTSVLLEIIVFYFLYCLIYISIKRTVVKPIDKVNTSLDKICAGDLNVVVDAHTSYEISSLSNDINHTVSALKGYIELEKTKNEAELTFAKTIQHSSLPSTFPPFPTYHEFDIFASMDTAKEVGGDFYDFYLVDPRHLVILIADVSGKGIPAAMFMMQSKTIIKSLMESGHDVDTAFTEANNKLCEGNDAQMFVTAWMGLVDLDTGLVKYVNAGHNPPLVKHSDGSFEYLKQRPGFVLAGMDGILYKKQEIELADGDQIYLYTDGVTEATSESKELYGEARLLNIINESVSLSAEELCKAIINDVDKFVAGAEQSDDITMLSFQFYGKRNIKKLKTLAVVENIPMVTDFVNEFLEENDCPMKVMTQIDIVIDEIFSNIAFYAYPKDSKGEARVTVEITKDNNIILVFEDHGIPYNPLKKDDPDISLAAEDREIGGLGIFMVKKTMDDISYMNKNGRNVLTLTKKM